MKSNNTQVHTSVMRGLPDLSGHHFQSNGMFGRGKAAALAVMKHGIGNHSVTTLPADRNIIQSFTAGARTISKKHGNPLRVTQKKDGEGCKVFIMFRSDLEDYDIQSHGC